MTNTRNLLSNFVGTYRGLGKNHEGQTFEGSFHLTKILNGHGFEIQFTATGLDGAVYHAEKSTLAMNSQEKFCLFNLNTNVPFMTEHLLLSMNDTGEDCTRLIFQFNEPTDAAQFREQIWLELFADGTLGYHFHWGMPQGEFGYRSGVVMTKTNSQI